MTTKTDRSAPTTGTDRIEQRHELRAPRARVWRALTDAAEFGTWFGARIEGAFAPGRTVRGQVSACGHENLTVEIQVGEIKPEHYFSYRWHPYAVDPAADYSGEPTTLVEFHLEEIPGGTALTIVESGFDRIPIARRAEAFRKHGEGWVVQAQNLANHVA